MLRAIAGIVHAMPRLELFPFRYLDRLTGKWVKARYVASRREIAERHAEFGSILVVAHPWGSMIRRSC